MPERPDPVPVARAALSRLVEVHGDGLPLDRMAALLAQEESPDHPEPDMLLAWLDRLAASIVLRPGSGIYDGVARLSHLLFEDMGFQGDQDDYDDPQNSCLDRVLSRRRGLPILLSVLTVEVGRRVGVPLEPVGFPSHFLVGARDGSKRFYVDPFHGGRIIREDQLRSWLCNMMERASVDDREWERAIRPSSGRAVAVRMNENLKAAWLRRGDHAGALRAVERLIVLLEEPWDARRDRGILLIEMGRRDEGRAELSAYIQARPQAPDAGQVARRLRLLDASRASD